MRDRIDFVQVISWNGVFKGFSRQNPPPPPPYVYYSDYGESHYIGPIKVHLYSPYPYIYIHLRAYSQGAQPNSEAWVDGYPHEPWLYLNSYFARAFKSGVYPTIEQDQIFVWARPHPKDAIANEDISRPDNWEFVRTCLPKLVLSLS